MGRPGLRGRIAASLVLTTAIALVVAAVTLLSPLERKLRAQEVHDLVTAAGQSRTSFSELDLGNAKIAKVRLRQRVRRLATVTGARVALLDSQRHVLADTDPDARDPFRDATAALATDRAVRRIVRIEGQPEARVAIRLRDEGKYYVLALRKPLTEQRAAVTQVTRAFGTAALVALAVALLVAGFFAATVGRRVRSLHAAVVRFGIRGRPEELPDDRAADEVGDLSRAFVEMANRLRHEEDVRREFVATASHELRTPLMTLQGRLEMLEDELALAAPDMVEGRRHVADARDQADRLGRLASDLLDLSRLDAEVELHVEDFDVGELVRAVAAEFAIRANAMQREVELDLNDLDAVANPTACARIVRSLLDNALRYTDPAGPIRVAVARDGKQVTVTVSDPGPAIPEGDSERIFERFARGAGSNPAGGFGLGLAIARELSERMGGSLELAKTGGPGNTFVLRLPPAHARPNAIPTKASSA